MVRHPELAEGLRERRKFIGISLAWLFATGMFLAGCASLPDRAPVADKHNAWRERQTVLARLDTWELRGRVALRTAQDGGQASLHWLRKRDSHRIDLAGPFGGGRVRLTQEAGAAELRDSSGRVWRDRSLTEVLARATGWRLPLEGLDAWALGLPAPGEPAELELDEWGRLKRLVQLGWDISFLNYAEHHGYELPSRLFIKRAGGGEPEVEVRLAISEWTLSPAVDASAVK
jgi:outer membrane lipoprotein LolB